jgi:MinD-like ATPase involved in chromosome partitioning or flagellar assembly
MKIQVDAMIPSSRLVPTSLNKGRPVVLDEPNSEVTAAIKQLAAKFAGGTGGPVLTEELATVGAAPADKKRKRGLFSKK